MSTSYVRIILIGLMAGISSALICYDSSTKSPKNTAHCSNDMVMEYDEVESRNASVKFTAMCYSEYYAVNRSGTVRQYFDRFCVHRKHCLDRGIDESCQTLEQLDKGIQKTFFKYHHAKPSRKTLMHSRFCCCETDRCNNFNSDMAFDMFGVTSTSQSLPSLLINVILSISMWFIL